MLRTQILLHSVGQIKLQASPYCKIGELDSESKEEQKTEAIYTNSNLAQNPSLVGDEDASKSPWAQSSKKSPPIFQQIFHPWCMTISSVSLFIYDLEHHMI